MKRKRLEDTFKEFIKTYKKENNSFDGVLSKKEFEELFLKKYDTWKKATVQIRMGMCTVNDKTRLQDSHDDVFILKDKKLYEYTSNKLKEFNLPYFKDFRNKDPKEIINDFLNDIDSNFEIFPSKSDVLLITNCSSLKHKDGTFRLHKAKNLYKGPQHKKFKELVNDYKIDWYIMSGKYLLVPSNKRIKSYDKLITGLKYCNKNDILKVIKITDNLISLIKENNYKNVIFAVSSTYHTLFEIDEVTKHFPNTSFHVIGKYTNEKDNVSVYKNDKVRDLNFFYRKSNHILKNKIYNNYEDKK